MSRHESHSGDAQDGGSAQAGNRPAQNARLSTPGMLSIPAPAQRDGASDFLGLDAEVGGSMDVSQLMSHGEVQSAEPEIAERQPSAWVETQVAHERIVADTGQEFPEQEPSDDVGYEDSSAQPSDSPHGSWSESAPKRGSGKLIGVAAGVLVLGLLGAAAAKFLVASKENVPTGEPVASRTPPRSERTASLLVPVQGEDEGEAQRTSPEGAGALAEVEGTAEAVDPQQAREAFEQQRGDAPPAWFDPTLDSQGEAPETGWTPEAEAVTRGATFIGDPTALLVAGMDSDSDGGAAAEPLVAGTSTQASEEPAQSQPSEPAAEPVSKASVAIIWPEDEVEDEVQASTIPATKPVAVAAVTASTGDIGPQAPTTGAAAEVGESAIEAHHESRQSRTSTLKVEDVLLAPTMDGGNLRQANAKDLSGVWNETTVPMEALGSKTKVLTPNVGRVRVVLKSKDIFEGRLYAVGQGSVWLESEYGRISVDGKRIASVANIDTKEGTPALGATGSQNLLGLEKVRVKTPGGTFYGKVIARDDTQTTLITEDGARLTLSNADVEVLTDSPKVTIGGKVDEVPKKP